MAALALSLPIQDELPGRCFLVCGLVDAYKVGTPFWPTMGTDGIEIRSSG